MKENQIKDVKQDDENDDNDDEDESKIVYQYICPAFKTSKRTSIISASGRSDEHIISIVRFFYIKKLNSKKPGNFWIMRGVALITMLDT